MVRVLVVDDDNEIRRTVRAMLRGEGYDVVAVASAHEALGALELSATDLVISDVEMPLMSGIELAHAMVTRRLDVPVLLMSGRPRDEVVERARDCANVEAFLQKPFRPSELRQLVRGIVSPRMTAPPQTPTSSPYPRWSFPAPPTVTTDPEAAKAHDGYWSRQAQLTKPPRSLGRLEHVAAQLAVLQRSETPRARPAVALLFASDHPVADLGVSAYPMAVTRAMVQNFAHGGAAASVLCRMHDLPLVVTDVGVQGGAIEGLPATSAFRYVRAACADMPVDNLVGGDAMPRRTFLAALRAGDDAVAALPDDTRAVIVGEMGIGNSTCAAAVTAALLGAAPETLVGPGTGVTGARLEHKIRVVVDAIERAKSAGVDVYNGFEAMRVLGGRDLAAMMGAMAAAVERRIAVVVDGYIATAAALALIRVDQRARSGLIFAHTSREPGHRRALEFMGVQPLMQLDMALGEGSGALVAWPVIEAACRLHGEMATFASARVPDRDSPPTT